MSTATVTAATRQAAAARVVTATWDDLIDPTLIRDGIES
jgi:hypothetical protein